MSTSMLTRPSTLHDPVSLLDAVAAGYGGYSTLRKHARAGLVASEKVGRRVYLERSDLDHLREPTPVEPRAADPLDTVIREWAERQAVTAPPMSARDALIVARILRAGAAA